MTGDAEPRGDHVRPVTRSRISEALSAEGYRFRLATDGSIVGTWDGNQFTISLIGQDQAVVQVRGTWHRPVAADLAAALAQVVNDWNRDRIWPKVYTRAHGVGLRVHTAVAVDLADGATDAQVREVIACGLGTGVQFFSALGDLLAEDMPAEEPPTDSDG